LDDHGREGRFESVIQSALSHERAQSSLRRTAQILSLGCSSDRVLLRTFAMDQATSALALRGLAYGVFRPERLLYMSVPDAVCELGIGEYRRIHLACSVLLAARSWLGKESVLADEIFLHGVCSAAIFENLLPSTADQGDRVFSAMAAHLGLACLASFAPTLYSAESPLHKGESESIEAMESHYFGFTHLDVTLDLLRRLEFPLQFWETSPGFATETLALCYSDALAQELGCRFGFAQLRSGFDSSAYSELGLGGGQELELAQIGQRSMALGKRVSLVQLG
nr:HDOD domain-containing protein [Fimbriimonadaceae bacterium]